MDAIQLFRVDFDTMENHTPIAERLLGTFVEEEKHTAHFKVNEFLDKYKAPKLYLGYDGNVYPQYKLISIQIN